MDLIVVGTYGLRGMKKVLKGAVLHLQAQPEHTCRAGNNLSAPEGCNTAFQ
jgi:hypothetical protein